MPELPEVESIKNAIRGVVEGRQLEEATFYRKDLREPMPIQEINRELMGRSVDKVWRRSKYMLWNFGERSLVFHLGMSGNILLRNTPEPELKHTHFVLQVGDHGSGHKRKPIFLHYIDPRRFGRLALIDADVESHSWFSSLGPEPLTTDDLGELLWQTSRGRSQSVKAFLMDAKTVVGVGNIYAAESLHQSGIHPESPCGKINRAKYQLLGEAVKKVLADAIQKGGTSFRDFRNADGGSGYFAIELSVYGREGETCLSCGKEKIQSVKIAGRSSFYCPRCQRKVS